MKIINVPIESLEERYSKQWNEWFPNYFNRSGIEWINVYPQTLTDKITEGSFLDVCGTNYFKAGQLQILTKMIFDNLIVDGDIIFFHDLWFPGIEMLQYIRQGKKVNFKICGIIHAGTYDQYDFLSKSGMEYWGKPLEESWFSFIDKIFVATNFHKELLLKTRNVLENKIVVTGLPIFPQKGYCVLPTNLKKEKIVVFPHRLDSEKNPDLFDVVESIVRTHFPDWRFVKTKEVTKNKDQYYNLLNRSSIAVSLADQETWGIAQQEAVFAGCYPVVPNRLSYKEMYSGYFQYNWSSGFKLEIVQNASNLILRTIEDLTRADDNLYFSFLKNQNSLKQKGIEAIPNMIKEMEKL